MKKIYLPFVFSFLLISIFAKAQPGTLDSSFGTDGKVYVQGTYCNAVGLQKDGKILQGGLGAIDDRGAFRGTL